MVFGCAARELGPYGEKLAAKFLKRLGYRILKQNYHCLAGEIDIIAADGDTLVFVEVKTRSDDTASHPEDAVGLLKRRQVVRVAKFFLARMQAQHIPARFDILAIVVPPGRRARPLITHFKDAFQPCRR